MVEEGDDEGEEGGGLDGGAVGGVEEVEEKLVVVRLRSWFRVGGRGRNVETYVHIDFASEKGARRGVQEEDALDQVERGDYEEIVLSVWR